ncbi:MAG: hypothetical protein CM1200mP2_41890 [Planctomycetaceae bacterium]|nr:MAG: hypothetical protein CM1200mP2_41890 [Planctomycetaceae bacterium]
MRQQAANFGTRIQTDDIVSADLSTHPFQLTTLDGTQIEAFRSSLHRCPCQLPGPGK